MKKQVQTSRKLILNRTTLRALSRPQLELVMGALGIAPNTKLICTNTCVTCVGCPVETTGDGKGGDHDTGF